MKNIIELKNITINYNNKPIFKNFSCEFQAGKFYTILGPSGCGKTTLLNIIAGFIKPEIGEVYINSENVTNLEPNHRSVNTIFQDYALFPHLNVFENIAFGLKLKNLKPTEINEKVLEALELVNLKEVYDRNISELSGGQKQRIAIARAIVNEPKVLLLDEPLSALDLKLRVEMQYMLKELQKKLGITFIFITHDQEEALALSDYIYVLNDGKIMQKGNPIDIYDEPKNKFVANFIGESNILKAIYLNDKKIEMNGNIFQTIDEGFKIGQEVDVIIRPEDIKIDKIENSMIEVIVDTVTFKGMNNEIIAHDINGNEWIIHTIKHIKENEKLGINFTPEDIHLMEIYEETL